MEWTDEGIVLSARRHGERSAVVSLLTSQHGRHAGFARGVTAGSGRGLYLPGNRVHARWRARLDQHLGHYSCELLRADAAALLEDPGRLACLSAACAMVEASLPERQPHTAVHAGLSALLDALTSGTAEWESLYVRWEVGLLGALGYGLDLGECAVTGRNDGLVYVSPRTGRAVSASAGEPYHDRLLPLPRFLTSGGRATPADIAAGLRLTGHFLTTHVTPVLPPARARLASRFEPVTRSSHRDAG
ncbi:MAG: DNA repair protein RecO [Alphaproteobacteria bacterium]